MALVNNTHCDILFRMTGAIDKPCGNEIAVQGHIPANTTIRWNDPGAVDWNVQAGQIYWRGFSIDSTGKEAIGNCYNNAIQNAHLAGCNTGIEYQWQEDAKTGNVEVIINYGSPTISPAAAAQVKKLPSKGSTTIYVIPMLDAYINANKLHTRTNQSFMVSATTDNAAHSIALKPAGRPNETCRIMPVGATIQQVYFNCYCGMEQVFELEGNTTEKVLYSITEL